MNCMFNFMLPCEELFDLSKVEALRNLNSLSGQPYSCSERHRNVILFIIVRFLHVGMQLCKPADDMCLIILMQQVEVSLPWDNLFKRFSMGGRVSSQQPVSCKKKKTREFSQHLYRLTTFLSKDQFVNNSNGLFHGETKGNRPFKFTLPVNLYIL